MRSVANHLWLIALIAAATSYVPAQAATPREQLLHYVPEKVGFCLVLNDLRGHSQALFDSPLAEQFQQSPLGLALAASAEVKQLAKVEQDLKELLGLDWKQLRDDVFGDAIVFAYRPGPPGKPEQEQGIILVHARDPKLLAKLIDTINTKQKASGDLKELEEKQHKGIRYFRRTEKTSTNYYHLDGSLLLFTAQEDMLREALELGLGAKKDAESPVAQRFRQLSANPALLSLWLNPRAFDAELQAKLADRTRTEADNAFMKAFAPYWKALDSVVVAVTLEKELKVQVAFQTRTADLPAATRRFLKAASPSSAVWPAIPDDAMFALGGRLDLSALFEMLGEFMSEANRKSAREDLNRTIAAVLGKEDFFKEVLPHIGPDFGLYLSAPATDEKGWFPHGVLALRVATGDEKPPFNQAVISALNAYAFAAVLGHNKLNPKQQMSLKTVLQGTREVKYLVSEAGFPPGFQPALALHENFVVLATTPEVLRRFAAALTPGEGKTKDEVPLLRASFKEMRRWLKERQEVLVPIMAEQNKLTKEEAGARLGKLLGVLELVDRLEISQRSTPGQAVFTVTLQTSRPLRK